MVDAAMNGKAMRTTGVLRVCPRQIRKADEGTKHEKMMVPLWVLGKVTHKKSRF